MVDARGHIGVKQQRLGIHVNNSRRSLADGSLLDEIFDGPTAALGAPGIHALLDEPHAVDESVEAEPAGGRTEIGIACVKGFRGGDGRGSERAYQRPGSGTDVGGGAEADGNAGDCRGGIVGCGSDELGFAIGVEGSKRALHAAEIFTSVDNGRSGVEREIEELKSSWSQLPVLRSTRPVWLALVYSATRRPPNQ